MATEEQKQDARQGGYEVKLVGKGTYDTYVIYRHDAEQPGEFGLLESAWDEAVARRFRDYEH